MGEHTQTGHHKLGPRPASSQHEGRASPIASISIAMTIIEHAGVTRSGQENVGKNLTLKGPTRSP
jgi:hypothetical protein